MFRFEACLTGYGTNMMGFQSISRSLLAVAGRSLARVRRVPRRFAPALLCGLMLWTLNGAQPANKREPPKIKPWIDLKNLCMLPLGGRNLPDTPDELQSALVRGWSHALTLPNPQKCVLVDGDKSSSLRTVRIDLSNGTMDPDRKAEKGSAPVNRAVSTVGISRFELVGQPLICDDAHISLTLTADDVRMDLEHDRRGHPIMLLNDVDHGTLRFDASFADLDKIILARARRDASPYGIDVKDTQFRLTTDPAGRELTARLRLQTTFCYIPAGMNLSAHVKVDDAMNAQLSNLKCDGDEVLGPIVVGMLRPFLAKYEDKTRPLIGFPSPDIHLRDVSVTADESVHLTATFSSK
jgi:hypothetical protein